jgi:hypothetical protein
VLETVFVAVPANIVVVKVGWAVPVACSGEPGPAGLDFFLLHAWNMLIAKITARTIIIVFFILNLLEAVCFIPPGYLNILQEYSALLVFISGFPA